MYQNKEVVAQLAASLSLGLDQGMHTFFEVAGGFQSCRQASVFQLVHPDAVTLLHHERVICCSSPGCVDFCQLDVTDGKSLSPFRGGHKAQLQLFSRACSGAHRRADLRLCCHHCSLVGGLLIVATNSK